MIANKNKIEDSWKYHPFMLKIWLLSALQPKYGLFTTFDTCHVKHFSNFLKQI